jgi:selenocysteine lyase/cysteine desulfurase
MIDLDRVRADTPAAAAQSFLLNAGSSLMPNPVLEAMIDHLRLEAEVGGYEAADREQERLTRVYDSIAAVLNACREEIAIVGNATIAWQMAFYAQRFAPGDRILTAQAEYAANYVAYLQMARRAGVSVEVVPSNEAGELDTRALRAIIDERVKLISMTWVPTNGGLVNPAEEVGAIARGHGIPYLLDACQMVGQRDVDVRKIGCDMLSATARKFLRGPRGMGFLYVRQSLLETLEPPMIDHFAAPWTAANEYRLRDDARRFETWENNYAARLGLGAAVDYAIEIGLDAIETRCRRLAARLRTRLQSGGSEVHDLGRDPCAIVSFSVPGWPAEAIVSRARDEGIVIGLSKPASTLLDSEARHLPAILRASPHYFNSDEDVDRLAELCARLARPPARAS